MTVSCSVIFWNARGQTGHSWGCKFHVSCVFVIIESHKITGLEDTMVESSVHSHIHIPSPGLSMWLSPCWPIPSIFGSKTVLYLRQSWYISPRLNDHTQDYCAIREMLEKGIVLRTLILFIPSFLARQCPPPHHPFFSFFLLLSFSCFVFGQVVLQADLPEGQGGLEMYCSEPFSFGGFQFLPLEQQLFLCCNWARQVAEWLLACERLARQLPGLVGKPQALPGWPWEMTAL